MKRIILCLMAVILAASTLTACDQQGAPIDDQALTIPMPGTGSGSGDGSAQADTNNDIDNISDISASEVNTEQNDNTGDVEVPGTPVVSEPSQNDTPTAETTVEGNGTGSEVAGDGAQTGATDTTVETPETPETPETQTPEVQTPETQPDADQTAEVKVTETTTPQTQTTDQTTSAQPPAIQPSANDQKDNTQTAGNDAQKNDDIPAAEETANKETPKQQTASTEPWNLILVNPWNYLPDGFQPNTRKIEGHYIDVRAYDDLVEMLKDMRAEGLKPYICSSYRTVDYQKGLYNRQVTKQKNKGLSQQKAEEEAAKWVAIPGTSEHHTGLALDIVAADHVVLDESQENTPEQQWLMKNSYKYGFILRYPNGKTNITGIYYEPWHYRYVGRDHAKKIYDSKLTLEEYLGKVHK